MLSGGRELIAGGAGLGRLCGRVLRCRSTFAWRGPLAAIWLSGVVRVLRGSSLVLCLCVGRSVIDGDLGPGDRGCGRGCGDLYLRVLRRSAWQGGQVKGVAGGCGAILLFQRAEWWLGFGEWRRCLLVRTWLC